MDDFFVVRGDEIAGALAGRIGGATQNWFPALAHLLSGRITAKKGLAVVSSVAAAPGDGRAPGKSGTRETHPSLGKQKAMGTPALPGGRPRVSWISATGLPLRCGLR